MAEMLQSPATVWTVISALGGTVALLAGVLWRYVLNHKAETEAQLTKTDEKLAKCHSEHEQKTAELANLKTEVRVLQEKMAYEREKGDIGRNIAELTGAVLKLVSERANNEK